MVQNGPNRKVNKSLVALSSAAIIAVYAAGYARTKDAADRFDFEAARRKRLPVVPAAAAPSAANAPPAAPAVSATPAPSPSPEVTRSAVATPRPNAAPRAATSPPIETASAAAAPAPPEPSAQTTSVEPQTAPPPAAVTPSLPVESQGVDGDDPAPPPAGQYKDGTYTGWGTCRHGDVQVELVIRAGRIAWASISKCYTRYPCSWIDRLVPEVVGQQGPPLTYVSGASESSDALYYAVIDALSKAK